MDKLIVNVETNETEIVALTSDEIAEIDAELKTTNDRLTEASNSEAAKAAQRQAILDRLGLSAEEAALLLGGN